MADQPVQNLVLRQRVRALPNQPGVYLFTDAEGTLLYVGKALSLRKRVASYFRRSTALAPRIERMVNRASSKATSPRPASSYRKAPSSTEPST